MKHKDRDKENKAINIETEYNYNIETDENIAVVTMSAVDIIMVFDKCIRKKLYQ